MAREQKTSFNICSVSVAKYGSAYQHQKPEHRATLNYIHSDRTQLNESWHKEYQANGHPKTLKNYLSDTKKIVKEKTGRAMQKKAEDNVIGEAVVVIDEQTTMQDLQKLGKAMEQRYGWTCVQIHIHRDEGYLGERTEDMKHREGKYNLHAHMFFVTTNLATGKSWKRQRGEGSVMQDITAQTLDLTRGVRKSERTEEVKETLNVVEYKEDQARKNLEKIKQEKETIGEEVEQAKAELEQVKTAKEIRKEEAEKALEGVVGAVTGALQGVGRKADEARKTLKEHAERLEEIEEGKYIIERANELKTQNKPQIEEIKKRHTKKTLFGEKVDLEAVLEDYQEIAESRADRLQRKMIQEREESKREIGSLRWQVEKQQETINSWQVVKRQWEEEKQRIVEKLGDKFKSLYEDCKSYFQGFVDNLSTAIGLWLGERYSNGKKGQLYEEYSATREEGRLRVNDKTLDQLEKERQQEQQQSRGRGMRF